ncbi:hypothetical protein KSE_74280 [Kitasatospora setae KM-6054]|uniref:Uncharacterized protein n=1 Tax=Kitasatospora setae (strain ATCC 33774 / DSM 43861 / JCM 3304 / KCC A-0304 / NBRC 14216 / KM-6054) TaxID=452652 RepID=E4NJN5_KITSK|nr:hypothetical protein KSE_74280 [Kitasatospora setae KM-6054]
MTAADAQWELRRRVDNRATQLDRMRARLAELGVDPAALRGIGAESWTRTADRLEAALTEDLRTVFADLGGPDGQWRQLRLAVLAEEDVYPECKRFADGSALMVLPESFLGLAGLYSGFGAQEAVRVLDGGPWRAWRNTRAALRRKAFGTDPAGPAALLRYHFLHQRVFGLSAKPGWRTDPRADGIRDVVLTQAVRFVLGHELAHQLHGHRHGAGPAQELEADLTAHRLTRRSLERDAAAARTPDLRLPVADVDLLTTWGSTVALFALAAREHALFVRIGDTHPPSEQRMYRLLDELAHPLPGYAALFLGNAVRATNAAADFTPVAVRFTPRTLTDQPHLDTPLPAAYLERIAALDTLLCLTRSPSWTCTRRCAATSPAAARPPPRSRPPACWRARSRRPPTAGDEAGDAAVAGNRRTPASLPLSGPPLPGPAWSAPGRSCGRGPEGPHPVRFLDAAEFTADRPWGSVGLAELDDATVRLHWTDQPYRWHVNDGPEVFVVLDGAVDMHYRVDGEEHVEHLTPGRVCAVEPGDEHVAHPAPQARILVVERRDSD